MEIPQLWKVMSSEPEKLLTSYKKNTGSGINKGTEKGDYLATKDGWMKFKLVKRLDNNIITQEEYNNAIREYYEKLKFINEFKISKSRKERYSHSKRLEIPIIDISKNTLCEFDLKVLNAINELSQQSTGLFTYKKISEHINLKHGELACSQSVRRLWHHYYKRDNVYDKF